MDQGAMNMERPDSGNLFAGIPARLDAEAFGLLYLGPGVRIERILSRGQSTPAGTWYDQPGDEWVALLAGHAELEFDDGSRRALLPGDWLLLPAHCRHRVATTSTEPAAVWLAVHIEPGPPA